MSYFPLFKERKCLFAVIRKDDIAKTKCGHHHVIPREQDRGRVMENTRRKPHTIHHGRTKLRYLKCSNVTFTVLKMLQEVGILCVFILFLYD